MTHTDAKQTADKGQSRRELLGLAAAAAVTLPALDTTRARAQTAPNVNRGAGGKPNILFIFTDQERYRTGWPAGVTLPAHERMQRTGVTFHNHHGAATMCTSARAVMLTGLQTADNRMFENVDTAWTKSLSTKVPTIGHMMRKAGYYTAYKGKWHLTKEFDTKGPTRFFTKEMEQYGFSDYFSPGDFIGHTLGGHQYDHMIASGAVNWLRKTGRPLTDDGKPWSMCVSFVNPHDIMYFNTDKPGENVQDSARLMMHASRAPAHELYKATWDVPLPGNINEPFGAAGRPGAHTEFLNMWNYVLGHIPNEEERWRRFNDYYINCTRAVDIQISTILRELDDLGLTDRTIVVYTSDHGEMAGAHGLHGKGPFAYKETSHLPLYIVHPDVKGGQDCQALTGQIDIAPTFLAMAGISAGKSGDVAGRTLPGKDLTPLLTSPGSAGIHAARENTLFTYSGLASNDSSLWRIVDEAKAKGQNPAVAIVKQGYKPNLRKRGSLRSVFDGRYRFTRYFSPLERNRPGTLDELFARNDVELFDLQADPDEMTNLAMKREANKDLLTAMNIKLEAAIKAEIGVDDGREMPNVPLIEWTIDRPDL